jgi:hypothetical protein
LKGASGQRQSRLDVQPAAQFAKIGREDFESVAHMRLQEVRFGIWRFVFQNLQVQFMARPVLARRDSLHQRFHDRLIWMNIHDSPPFSDGVTDLMRADIETTIFSATLNLDRVFSVTQLQ